MDANNNLPPQKRARIIPIDAGSMMEDRTDFDNWILSDECQNMIDELMLFDWDPDVEDALNGANGEWTGSDDVDAYKEALLNPFSPQAAGARVCDEWALPTGTRTVHTTNTITVANTNAWSVMLTPHPLMTACIGSGNATMTWGGTGAYTTNTDIFFLASNSALSGAFINYRIVGGGVRIKNMQAPLGATGRIEIAQVPLAGTGITSLALDTVAFSFPDLTQAYLGATSNNGDNFISLLGFPHADEYTVTELLTHDIAASFKPSGPDSLEFYKTVPRTIGSSGYEVIDDGALQPLNTTSVAASKVITGLPTIAKGWNAICIRGTSFPAGATLEIEYILHLEGTPSVLTTTILNNSEAEMQISVDPVKLQRFHQMVGKSPDSRLVSMIRAHAKQFGRGVRDGITNTKPRSKKKNTKVRNTARIGTDAIMRTLAGLIGVKRGKTKAKGRK